MISRTGEREELPRSPRGPCPPSALPSSPPISAGLEGASIHAADGAISKERVHGEFAPSAFQRWSWCLALSTEHLLLARHMLLHRPRHQLHFIVYGKEWGSDRLHFLASTTQHCCNTSRFGTQASKIPKPWMSPRLMSLSNGGRSPGSFSCPRGKRA